MRLKAETGKPFMHAGLGRYLHDVNDDPKSTANQHDSTVELKIEVDSP